MHASVAASFDRGCPRHVLAGLWGQALRCLLESPTSVSVFDHQTPTEFSEHMIPESVQLAYLVPAVAHECSDWFWFGTGGTVLDCADHFCPCADLADLHGMATTKAFVLWQTCCW